MHMEVLAIRREFSQNYLRDFFEEKELFKALLDYSSLHINWFESKTIKLEKLGPSKFISLAQVMRKIR